MINIKPIDKTVILEYLKGKPDHNYKAGHLSMFCNVNGDYTQREVRKIIESLIEEDYHPIISSSRGYQYTTDQDKLMAYYEALNSRQRGLSRRIIAIENIIRGRTK